jgi:outer membrane receptor protein involved in Fe transport
VDGRHPPELRLPRGVAASSPAAWATRTATNRCSPTRAVLIPFVPTEPLEPLVQDSYGLVDAWINWLSPDLHWRLGLSGKNLTDEEYLLTGYNLPQFGVVTGSYGAPQTFIATVEYRFFK